MENATKWLVDENGQPFPEHIERELRVLSPRLRREFPQLRDEAVLANILEEGGRKLLRHEHAVGPLEHAHGYAWVTIRSLAVTQMRRGSMRVARATLDGEEANAALGGLQSTYGTVEEVESSIEYREVLDQLTRSERVLVIQKRYDLPSREIAQKQGTTPRSVDVMFHRVKTKLAAVLRGRRGAAAPATGTAQSSKKRTA